MISQRCYSDIYELRELLKTYRAKGEFAIFIVYVISKLDDLIAEWEEVDNRELEEMYRELEGKE